MDALFIKDGSLISTGNEIYFRDMFVYLNLVSMQVSTNMIWWFVLIVPRHAFRTIGGPYIFYLKDNSDPQNLPPLFNKYKVPGTFLYHKTISIVKMVDDTFILQVQILLRLIKISTHHVSWLANINIGQIFMPKNWKMTWNRSKISYTNFSELLKRLFEHQISKKVWLT